MLAPWCERATTEYPRSPRWARRRSTGGHGAFPGRCATAAWFVAQPRDARARPLRPAHRALRMARRATRIAALEPDLAGRFRRGLFFPDEAHLDPRRALAALAERLQRARRCDRASASSCASAALADMIVDCRGLAARDACPICAACAARCWSLRCARRLAARGRCALLHPRFPLYIVPRGDGVFMVGATMIESERRGRGQRALGCRAA